jgi:C1A family cysteine protease
MFKWFKKYFGPAVPKRRRYNWRRDLPDHRDIRFKYKTIPLPPVVDLRAKCPPVVDQGDLGSCTANALAGALGFLELAQLAQAGPDGPEELGTSFEAFSRLFIYWNERVIEGDTGQDAGAQIRDGIKSLASVGACSENTWTYDIKLAFKVPPPQSYIEASKHRISKYQALDGKNITELKTCLASGYPFVFGFTVYESFEGPGVAKTGKMSVPTPHDKPVGGHAVMCVGYSDKLKAFIVRNSWGEAWGDKGYFYMPYRYMTHGNLTDDFWTIRY